MSNVKVINDNNPFVSLQLERSFLAALLKFNDLHFDTQAFVSPETFFEKTHSHIYSVLSQAIEKKQSTNSALVAQSLKNIGINTYQEVPIFDYVETLNSIQINNKGGLEASKEITKCKALRDVGDAYKNAFKSLKQNKSKELHEIINGADSIINGKINVFQYGDTDVIDLFGNITNDIEEIRNNPPDVSKFMMGPFPTINKLYGSLHKDSNITLIGARSGKGKTSLSLYYNTYIASTYNIPIIHCDNGEMTPEELKFRAVSMFSKGKVPYFHLERGLWGRSEEMTKIVREILPIIEKIKVYFVNVAGLDPSQTIGKIRRIYYQKIGRGNRFLTDFDYLKPFESGDFNAPEWKVMGHFIQQIKSFITNELPHPFWTSIQLNKSGITNNKTSNQVEDSEGAISISDRVTQQSSHTFILRDKLIDQLAEEGNAFGNSNLIPVKTRHLGEDYERALRYVKIGKNKYKRNYVNIDQKSFCFEDRGDLQTMMDALSAKYNVSDENTEVVDPNKEWD